MAGGGGGVCDNNGDAGYPEGETPAPCCSGNNVGVGAGGTQTTASAGTPYDHSAYMDGTFGIGEYGCWTP